MYSYNVAIMRHMIANMSKKTYNFLGLELFYPLIAVLTGLIFEMSLETE